MKRIWKIFATVVLLGLILVGCGKSGSQASSPVVHKQVRVS